MIRSLIIQFFEQASEIPEELNLPFLASKNGLRQPNIDDLMRILKEMTCKNDKNDKSYIILDALAPTFQIFSAESKKSNTGRIQILVSCLLVEGIKISKTA